MTETVGIDIEWRELAADVAANVQRQLDDITTATQATAKGMGEMSSGAATFKGVLAGLEVSKLIDQFGEFHARVIAQTAAFTDHAERLNVTVEQYQALRLAGLDAGVSEQQLEGALIKLNGTIGSAEQGNKKAIDTFNALGIKLLDAKGNARAFTDILPEAARALLNMQDGAMKTRLELDLFGRAGASLNPMLRSVSQSSDDLVETFKRAGMIVDTDVVEKLHRLQSESDAAKARIEALYAQVATPIYTAGLKGLAQILQDLADRANGTAGAWRDMDAAISKMNSPDDAIADFMKKRDVGALDDQIAALDKLIAKPRVGAASPELLRKTRDELIARRDGVAAAADALKRASDAEVYANNRSAEIAAMDNDLRNGGLPAKDAPTTAGVSNPVAKGGGARDRIQEAINQLVGEREAAEKALERMRGGASLPFDELMRQVDLEKKIADEIAKLGKYDPKDPRVQQIRDQVIAHEQAETALRKFTAAAKDAEETERRTGDGTAYLAAETKRLNDDLDTGRLSYEAYAAAMRVARDKAEDMRLVLEGQQEGIRGVVAGMEYAAAQWERQNRSFQQGQRLFNDMKDAATGFASDFNHGIREGKDALTALGDAGVNALNKISDKLMEMAMNDLFGKAFGGSSGGGAGGGGGGGFLGGIFDNIFGGFSAGGGSSISDLGSNTMIFDGAGFADGGDPPVGEVSVVGERGPELFIPKQAGTILTAGQTARALGGGGDTYISVPLTVHMGSFVSRAEQQQQLDMLEMRVTNKIVPTVLAAKKGGGAARQILKS